MRYLLKIRRSNTLLLMTAYEKNGEPVCEGRISQDVALFLIRALQREDAFDSEQGKDATGTQDHSVCYRNQNLYLAGVPLGLEGQERQKIAEDLTRLVPQRPPLMA